MDANRFGAFIAECRKEKNMTQADLAVKLNVTDKAVSRWERGIGFPDINTLEPLAQALEISVLELMKSEKMEKNEVTKEEAVGIVDDTLDVAKMQRRREQQERKSAFAVLGITAAGVLLLLLLDSMKWEMDTLIMEGIGVVFPLLCVCGFLALLGSGIWRKATGKASGQTFAMAFALLILLIAIMGLFFLAGALGIGPVQG